MVVVEVALTVESDRDGGVSAQMLTSLGFAPAAAISET
jgi:hypothetical protein